MKQRYIDIFFCVFCVFCGLRSNVFAQTEIKNTPENRSKALAIAKTFEVKVMKKPSWAERDDAPLFKMAWFSDTHVGSEEQVTILKNAFAFAKKNYQPDFALFGGDNSCYCAPNFRCNDAVGKKHAWFKAFLDKELRIPYKVICGDNWHAGFSKYFKYRNYAFDACGYHFLCASLDERSSGGEGCSKFKEETLKWIDADLNDNASKPTIFVMHESLWPPTFLEANDVAARITKQGNLVAAFSGHLHLDLDFQHGAFRQVVCPSLGRSHRPAFKLLRFYHDAIIIESCELNEKDGSFFMADKWQKIDIPAKLQPTPAPVKLNLKDTNFMKPEPVETNNSLSQRSKEVYNSLMLFAFWIGFHG